MQRDHHMIRSALIIVPHPDDEINLAGGIFETLYKNGVYTTVVICTNGDYIPQDATKRFYEAQVAQRIQKYQELIFLGYGDGYDDTHIYDAKDEKIVTSHSGHRHTYCAGDGEEYHFSKTGKHCYYTRKNYKEDIKSVILDKKADLIICVDLDFHLDHRCVSLLFDECMGEILKSISSYRPIILKGFAYGGVFFGPYDFFDTIIKQTSIDLFPDEKIDQKTFPYVWKDRIQIKNADKVLSLRLWKNPIFKALWAHKSQSDYYSVGFCALACFPRIANPDSCYWYKNPFNLSLYSHIEATSGEVSYLNDFMYARPSKTISEDISVNSKGWAPDEDDTEPYISIVFPRQVILSLIRFYQNINSSIDEIRIIIENSFETVIEHCDSNVIEIDIPSVPTSRLGIKITSKCEHLSINEIECFEDDYGFPWEAVPFEKYEHRTIIRNKLLLFSAKACYKLFIKTVYLYYKLKAKFNCSN